MNFSSLARHRYSSRMFSSQMVSNQLIVQVLEAARVAPSAANKQPWHFIVVTEPDLLVKLFESYPRDWFKNAPVVIIACALKNEAWVRTDGKNHSDIDLAIAIDHITLQATDLGLATCWICNFSAEKVIQLFNLPDNIEPVALIPLAYALDKPDVTRHELRRKKVTEIVSWNHYLNPVND